MATQQETLDLSPIGVRFFVKKTAQDTDGESLEMEWELFPESGGTPVHIHPHASETYRVLSGELEVLANKNWIRLKQGEEFTVEKGIPHTFRNPTDHVVRVYNIHRPAMHFYDYFKGLYQIIYKLSDNGKKKVKVNFNTATHLSMLMKKYDQEIVSVNPPSTVVSALNFIGKLRGIKV